MTTPTELREPDAEIVEAMAIAHEYSQFHDLIGPMTDACRAGNAALLAKLEKEKGL